MKTIKKIGLALIKHKAILLVRNEGTVKYLMPGGRVEKGENDLETLQREIEEELSCKIDTKNISYVGEYQDIAANDFGYIVDIKLYHGEIIGDIVPSNEIAEYLWFNPLNDDWSILSDIVKNKIIPDLINRKLI
ncbi:MAG: NUDIX domain-containing protein [Bacteroidales bacterium]|nr:NUDIX domain-containing protein [Bacteroidales bacterium]